MVSQLLYHSAHVDDEAEGVDEDKSLTKRMTLLILGTRYGVPLQERSQLGYEEGAEPGCGVCESLEVAFVCCGEASHDETGSSCYEDISQRQH